MTIDPDVPVPIDQAIIRGRIERGELAENRPIPSKEALRQEFGVAKGSIERALDQLKADGYLVTVMGRGTYVTPAAQRPRQP